MIFVNFKTYQEGSGLKALNLVKIIAEVADSSRVKIVPVLAASDIKEAVAITKLEIWAQHVDDTSFGAFTGSTLPSAVFEDGAAGTFLNHSEKKFPNLEKLTAAVKNAKEVGLKTLIFASSLEELAQIAILTPTYVAYEPPEFIGRSDISVTSAQPEIILKAVEIAKSHNLPLIVGAGIKSGEDVKKSLELGAVGIAVSSAIVKAENPKEALNILTEGFK